MISYADLKALEGFPVRIEYETARKAIRSRSGTLRKGKVIHRTGIAGERKGHRETLHKTGTQCWTVSRRRTLASQ